MRLLFATSIRTWGGGEEWMLSAAEGLAARGHRVQLAAPPESAVAERAREAALPVTAARFRADLDPASFTTVFRICRRERIQAMVLNMDRVLRVGGIAARAAGVPVVLPRRGSDFPLKDGWLYRFTYRRIATGVIVNSAATGRSLIRNVEWRPAGGVHVLPNHVDLERHERARSREAMRRELGLSAGAVVLLVVGELTTRKNADLLIRQLPSLRETVPELQVLLAGDGAERARWTDLARSLGLAEHVRFLGFRRDVPDLLAASDVLVHPARVEGFGYAVAEAMAAGLPVVATNASSLPELVVDGQTGRLFAPEDGTALAAALTPYLTDAELRRCDGERGRERARNEFSFERRLAELEQLLASRVRASTPG